jgi:hypothetical protein
MNRRTVARRVPAMLRFLRHAGPHVLEATIGPSVCFLMGRALWGLTGALALAMAWTGTCLGIRALRGRRPSTLLLIGATTLVLRSAVSFATRSASAFFLAPALVTAAMGMVYVASAFTSRPLLTRVVGDLIPPSRINLSDPRMLRICRAASVVWGAEQTISAVVSMILLFNVSTTNYVTMHDLVSWLTLAIVIGAILPFFWSDLKQVPWQRPAEDQAGWMLDASRPFGPSTMSNVTLMPSLSET